MSLIFIMFSLKVILCLSLVFNGFVSQNIQIGDYPAALKDGLNLPECGMRYKQSVFNITFDNSCYEKKYPPKIFYQSFLFEKPKDDINQRIFKGTPTDTAGAPWTVLITEEILKLDIASCTGSLITLEWVLTAAHCHKSGRTVHVIGGSVVREYGQKRYMNKWFPHPEYREPTEEISYGMYDIALMKMDRKFDRKHNGLYYALNTICLPARGGYYRRGPATFYGFGIIDYRVWFVKWKPDFLMQGKVELMPLRDNLCDNMYCTRYKSGDGGRPCAGDSGGPLVKYAETDETYPRGVQIGVTHGVNPSSAWYNPKSCYEEEIEIAMWTKVPAFIDWILETIEKN